MKLFYIDPQSYNNLSIYDKSLLNNISGCNITYYHNIKYQCEKIAGIEYKSIYNYSEKKHIFKAISYISSTIHVMVDCLREKPDVVHIQWFRLWVIDYLFVYLLRVLNISIVHTAHNILPHNPKRNERKHYLWYYNHVNAIIVHTQRTKDEMIKDLGVSSDKIEVIPHGMLPSSANESEICKRTNELKHSLNVDGKIVFASLGFQNYYKGIDIISEVWEKEERLNSNPKCMLLIVGKVENANLDTLSKYENIHIVDKTVSDVDFDAYLRLTSVALLPYREISQSGILLTTLQRNVPVIVSNVGGLTDPFNYATIGWNIGQPSVKSLSKAMIHLIDNPNELDKIHMDTDAFEKVKSAYSWKKIGQITSSLYMKIKS